MNLGNGARDEKEQGDESEEKQAVRHSRSETFAGGGCGAAHAATSPEAGFEASVSRISPAACSARRSRTGPRNSPTIAESTAMASTVSPTVPGKRRANASPTHTARPPDESRDRPTSHPALRADRDEIASIHPTITLATRRAPMAAPAIHGRAGLIWRSIRAPASRSAGKST